MGSSDSLLECRLHTQQRERDEQQGNQPQQDRALFERIGRKQVKIAVE